MSTHRLIRAIEFAASEQHSGLPGQVTAVRVHHLIQGKATRSAFRYSRACASTGRSSSACASFTVRKISYGVVSSASSRSTQAQH